MSGLPNKITGQISGPKLPQGSDQSSAWELLHKVAQQVSGQARGQVSGQVICTSISCISRLSHRVCPLGEFLLLHSRMHNDRASQYVFNPPVSTVEKRCSLALLPWISVQYRTRDIPV